MFLCFYSAIYFDGYYNLKMTATLHSVYCCYEYCYKNDLLSIVLLQLLSLLIIILNYGSFPLFGLTMQVYI